MTTSKQDPLPSSSPNIQPPAHRRSSWFQQIRQRVSTPAGWGQLWQNIQSRNATRSNLTSERSLVRYSPPFTPSAERTSTTNVPLATRVAQIGRRLSTPVAIYRPHTAPPNPNAVTFRPTRWEIRVEDAHRSSRLSIAESKPRCPYDPKVLQFFDSFDASASFCGLASGWPWSTRQRIPTPCDDCLQGTDRAHINVSPSRFSKDRSRAQRRTSSTKNVQEDVVPDRPVEEVSPDLLNSQPRTAQTPKSLWQKSLQTSSTWNLSQRPPERMGHRPEYSSEATFNHLKQVVSKATAGPPGPFYSPPPRLHQLSPDISFIHRHEVAAHQAAILSARHSPVLQHQARGSNTVDVIGYTFHPGRRDSSTTVLYSESSIPGEYIPPSPHEIPSPTRVASPFRRQAISLKYVDQRVLVPRLDQPPFVPALPEGMVLRPLGDWGRSESAPESWDSALRHSAVYRARGANYSPRVPSPLHEQHGAESLRVGSSGDEAWSHGTMPVDEKEVGEVHGRRRRVNEESKEPRLRGGGNDHFSLPVRGDMVLDQHWERSGVYDGTDLDAAQHHEGYFHCKVLPEGYRLDACMRPTAEMPRLRGGGGKPDRKAQRIPASLFYLASATGRKPDESITVDAWNSMKPKKRMGGLLGMAVYGYKGGKSYVPKTRDQEVQTEHEIVASETVDVGVGVEAPAAGPPPVCSPCALSPTPAPGLRTSQDGDEGSHSDNAPVSEPEEPDDPADSLGAEEVSQNAAEPVADKAPAPATEDTTNDAPASSSPEPIPKTPGPNDAFVPEIKAAEATKTPTPDNAAKDPSSPPPGDAPLPYPTTPSEADVSGKQGGTENGKPVQMPLTPEELVTKVVEEMKRKGLVG